MSDGLLSSTDPRGIATVTLDRPAVHNAFDDALIARLTETFERLGADPAIRAVVLAANGKSFSAGADLDWMRRMAGYSFEENVADATALATMLRTLDRFPKPTIARVQGAAYGGGVGLAACCDIVVAASSAGFCLSEVKLGIIPAVISPYVVNAIGVRQARRYFTTAEIIPASRAREIGLVHEVVDPAELDATMERIIVALLQGAPQAQAEAKELAFLSGDGVVDETVTRIARRRASAEAKEGFAAFFEKRPPAWRI